MSLIAARVSSSNQPLIARFPNFATAPVDQLQGIDQMREPPGKSIMLVIAKRFFHDGRDIVVVKEATIPFLAQLVFQFDDLPCGPQGGPFQIPPNSSTISLDMPDIFLDQHLQFGFFLGFGVHAGHVFHQPPDGDALFLGHEQSKAPGVGLPVGGHLGKQDAGADRVQDPQKGGA